MVGYKVSFNQRAFKQYLDFGMAPNTLWRTNFRDLNASVMRMVILAQCGRITEEIASHEMKRLQIDWEGLSKDGVTQTHTILKQFLSLEAIEEIDLFEQEQLAQVIQVCGRSKTIAEAGRILFNESRQKKTSSNDTNRLKVYLERFNLTFSVLQ